MSGAVLVGDIGGTNARFALGETTPDGRLQIHDAKPLPGDAFPTFADAVSSYLGAVGVKPSAALFAVAGVVRDGAVRLTHRDWEVSAPKLSSAFGFQSVTLVNDFAAMARAVPELPDSAFTQIKPGEHHRRAPTVVAGPGTGFGAAIVLPEGKSGWRILSGEGGHVAYAPRTAREVELANRLRAEVGYVSVELVSSGKYMDLVHSVLCEMHGVPWQRQAPAALLDAADEGEPVALELCRIRAQATMAAVGDLALIGGATGGIVLAGGVSGRLLKYIREEQAMKCFLDRGPRSDFMERLQVRLISDDMPALLGAAALHFEREGY